MKQQFLQDRAKIMKAQRGGISRRRPAEGIVLTLQFSQLIG
jgi:hypothetical protein